MSLIRLATPDDCAAVAALVDAAYAIYAPRIGRKPAPMLDDHAAFIRAKQVHLLEDDARIAGLIVLAPQADAMLIHNVAVAPAFQRRGFGRALMAFAERAASEAGCDRIDLYTNEAMVENIALYKRLGYAETHRSEESGFRRVFMSKRLGVQAPTGAQFGRT